MHSTGGRSARPGRRKNGRLLLTADMAESIALLYRAARKTRNSSQATAAVGAHQDNMWHGAAAKLQGSFQFCERPKADSRRCASTGTCSGCAPC